MVSKTNKTYIIAEIGLNHDGDYEKAKELIRQASNVGADAVKFQYLPRTKEFKDFPKLSLAQYKQLKKFSGVDVGLSVFAPYKSDYPFDFIKIASSAIYNAKAILDSLHHVRVPVFVSTGYALPRHWEGRHITFLACVSEYPATFFPKGSIVYMKDLFGKSGYSSHMVGYKDCVRAVKLGASVIEKHFCLDREKLKCDWDKKLSLEPAEFRSMVAAIRRVE